MQQMVEQTTQTNRCQTIWSLIQNKDLPPQMRARAAELRQKHIPAGQPCRMKSPKERFHHKQQLTDSNWQDGWQEGSFLGFFPPSLALSEHEPPLLSWEPAVCVCLAQTHVHEESDLLFATVCHRASKNSCFKLAENQWSQNLLTAKCTLSESLAA